MHAAGVYQLFVPLTSDSLAVHRSFADLSFLHCFDHQFVIDPCRPSRPVAGRESLLTDTAARTATYWPEYSWVAPLHSSNLLRLRSWASVSARCSHRQPPHRQDASDRVPSSD